MTTSSKFGFRTLSIVKDILAANYTDLELGDIFFQHGLLETYRGLGIAAKSRKVRDIFQHLVTSGDKASLATLSEIVTDTLKERGGKHLQRRYPDLIRCLAQDGFQLTQEGELIPVVSSTVEPAKEEGLVERLLDKYGFNIAKRFLEQSYDNYCDGNWESANATLRSFLQDVFDQTALLLWPDEAVKKCAGGERRQLLQDKGFIETTEAKLVTSFFSFASYNGSHPGISNEPDSRLRRYIGVALASYYLQKLGVINAE